jgi:hypothetical protein
VILVRSVAEVQPEHVRTRLNERLYGRKVIARRTERRDDLCVFVWRHLD